jgi:hypothetical protein
MADITLTTWTAPAATTRPAWLDQLARRAKILRRRARRNRYLALTSSARRDTWFEGMFRSMSGR